MRRRHFLGSGLAALIGHALVAQAQNRAVPRILLRSSWQTVNIGDIAHTPGVLRLLSEAFPSAELGLWPSSVADGVKEMLLRNFPKLKIFERNPTAQELAGYDFLLHGSGPSLVGAKEVQRWAQETGKPYGVYGITFSTTSPESIALLGRAQFCFFRDSVSLQFARDHGVTCPVMEFAPDGAFATRVRDDGTAAAFLKKNGLEEGQFLCVIPRYRETPYWRIKKGATYNEARNARNEQMKEHDHAPLREAIIAVVKETKMKVLICPEDQTQMEAGKTLLYDPLPEKIKTRVVWRENFWLTDEALSTYVRSAGLFGNEMHSPIMCIGNGIPAMVCRWAEQTSKGFMWKDIGLGDWLFDFDKDEDLRRLPPAVLAMAKDPAAAKEKAVKARAYVEKRQRETMEVMQKSLV